MKLATEETYLRALDRKDERPQRPVLTFVVSAETYGVELRSIREIIKLVEITEVPRAPRFVLGVTSVRGVIIPVIDLRLRLRLDATPPTRAARILVVAHDGDPFGLLVDAVRGVVKFTESDIEPPPSTLAADDSKLLAGICRYGEGRRERMVILLQLGAVVAFEIAAARRRRESV
jgi:purine-binding chemotaxis protein CheW